VTAPLETDVSLIEYGIAKTPDYIYEKENEKFILEYTVGMNRDRVEYQKGGGLVKHKYHEVSRKLSDITGIKHYYYTVPMILGVSNIDEISDLVSSLGGDFNKYASLFEEMYTIFSDKVEIINDCFSYDIKDDYIPNQKMKEISKSMWEVVEEKSVYEVSNSIEITASKRIVFLILSSIPKMENFLRKVSRPRVGIKIDLSTGYVAIDKNSDALDAAEVLKMMISKDIGKILQHAEIYNGKKQLNKSDLPGNQHFLIENVEGNQKDKISNDGFRSWFEVGEKYVHTEPYYQRNNTRFWQEKRFEIERASLDNTDLRYDFTPTVIKHKELKSCSQNFPDDYLEKLADLNPMNIAEEDKKKVLLANNVVDSDHLVDCKKFLDEKMNEFNSNYVYYNKRSFIVPLVTGELSYSESYNDPLNFDLYKVFKGRNPYTDSAMEEAEKGRYFQEICDEGVDNLDKQISEKEKLLYAEIKNKFTDKVPKRKIIMKMLESCADPDSIKIMELISEVKKIHVQKSKYIKENIVNKVRTNKTVKLRMGKNSLHAANFQSEMEHFGSKKGYYGVGDTAKLRHEENKRDFDHLCKIMLTKAAESCNSDPYIGKHGPGPDELTKLKKDMIEEINPLRDQFKSLRMGKAADFARKLSHTLFKLSTTSNNRDYTTMDNLGYDNVILFVRGGKKMYQTSKSKIFRVLHPIDIELKEFFGYNQIHTIKEYQGQHYVLTPWMQMNSDILLDTHRIFHRLFYDISVSFLRTKRCFETCTNFDLIPYFLAFHQRRQTEVTLHNTRYLIVNPMGVFSNLKGIIDSFANFNYSNFEGYLRNSIVENFIELAESTEILKGNTKGIDKVLENYEIKHIITGERLRKSYDLVSMIYMTYTMTKAPVTKSLEQASNLLPVIKDIAYYEENYKSVNKMRDADLCYNLLDERMDIYDFDFVYDPVFCQYLGYRTSVFLRKKVGKYKIASYWSKSIGKSMSNIAGPKGLRGFNPKNFFNQKGYKVVYEFIFQELFGKDLMSKIDVSNLDNYKEKVDKLDEVKCTIGDCCLKYVLTDAIFHMVDKAQRAGGREIFVMDIYTKFYQNPVEDFFKQISKQLDNEYISIPSNERPHRIHTMYYEDEREDLESYNMVLDCRRWAPHSSFQKYVYFIYGMSGILPSSFLIHFGVLASAMFDKVFVTREYVVGVIKGNDRYAPYLDWLKESALAKDAYVMKVKFSFVMGMFNYLSSVMHAANQNVAQEVIRRHFLKKHGSLVVVLSCAHSDDSVGKIYLEDKALLKEVVILYDYLLKGANHMISVKKSCISKNYMEFLSILYFKGEMLPVLRKFTGNIPFQATDSGYQNDVMQAASQAIEIMQNGGTMQEAYLLCKIVESYIRDFYNLPEAEENLPVDFLGLFDPHPMELLLGGTQVELHKHFKYNKRIMRKTMLALKVPHFISERTFEGIKMRWDMGARLNPKVKGGILKTIEKIDDDIKESWTVNNGSFKPLSSAYLWFCQKTNDPKFYSAMIADNPARKVGRLYGAFNHRSIVTDLGSAKVFEIYQLLKSIAVNESMLEEKEEDECEENPVERALSLLMYDVELLWDAFERIKVKIDRSVQAITLKPITISLSSPAMSTNITIPTYKYVSYVKEPQFYYLYGDRMDPRNQAEKISKMLATMGLKPEDLDPSDLSMVVQKFLSPSGVIRIVSYVDSDSRFVKTQENYINFICTSSIYGSRYVIKADHLRAPNPNFSSAVYNIPVNVVSYSKLYWAIKTIRHYDMSNYIKPRFERRLEELSRSVPVEWGPLVTPVVESSNLQEQVYWNSWVKKQIRTGSVWIGSGSFLVSLPEAKIEFKVFNEVITGVVVDGKPGEFSKTSSWYLDVSTNRTVSPMSQMRSTDEFSQTTDFLCQGEDGLWGINRRGKGNVGIAISLGQVEHPWVYASLPIELRENKNKVYYKGLDYEVNIALFSEKNNLIDVKTIMDVERLKEDHKNRINIDKINRFVGALQLQFFDVPVYDFDDLFVGLLSSKVYNVLGGYCKDHHVDNDTLIRSLFWYKGEIDQGFGMPSVDELKMNNSDKMALSLDPSVMAIVREAAQSRNLDLEEITILKNCLRRVASGEDSDILSLCQRYDTENVMKQSFVLFKKNINPYYILMFNSLDRKVQASYFNDFLDFLPRVGKHSKKAIFKANLHRTDVVSYIKSLLQLHFFYCTARQKTPYYKEIIDFLQDIDYEKLPYIFDAESENLPILGSTDFVALGRDRSLDMVKISLSNADFKKKAINEVSDLRDTQVICHQSCREYININKQLTNILALPNPEDDSTKKKKAWNKKLEFTMKKGRMFLCNRGAEPKTILDEDESEDAQCDLTYDGIEPECNDPITNSKPQIIKIALTETNYLLTGGSSRNLIYHTNFLPRWVVGCERKHQVFRRHGKLIDEYNFLVSFTRVRLIIEGWVEMSDKEIFESTRIAEKYETSIRIDNKKYDLKDLYKPENHKLRESMKEKAEEIYKSSIDPHKNKKQKLLDNMIMFGEEPKEWERAKNRLKKYYEEEVYTSLDEKSKKMKEESSKPFSIQEVLDSIFSSISEEELINIISKTNNSQMSKSAISTIISKYIASTERNLVHDKKFLGEFRTLMPGVFEEAITGNLNLDQTLITNIRRSIKIMVNSYKRTRYEANARAMALILDIIIQRAKIIPDFRGASMAAYHSISQCLNSLIKEDDDETLPAPLPQSELLYDISILE